MRPARRERTECERLAELAFLTLQEHDPLLNDPRPWSQNGSSLTDPVGSVDRVRFDCEIPPGTGDERSLLDGVLRER